MNLRLREIDESGINALKLDLDAFRDSGCRILIPVSPAQSILVKEVSGHLVMAPSDFYTLGFRFAKEKAKTGGELPQIYRHSYPTALGINLQIGHRDYFIYCNASERDSPESLTSRLGEMYTVPIFWMMKNGFAESER